MDGNAIIEGWWDITSDGQGAFGGSHDIGGFDGWQPAGTERSI